MLDHFAGPDLLHRLEVVVEARAAPLEWRSHRRVLLGEPADAEAQSEPTAAEHIE